MINIVFGGIPGKPQQFINHKDWSFVENKGQLADVSFLKEGEKISKVKYYSHEGGAHIYCLPGKISFVFTKAENENNPNVSEATGLEKESITRFPLPKPVRMEKPGGGAGGFGRTNLDHQNSKITTNRIDFVLLNSNPSAQITASDQQEYYENYYTSGDANNGITNVHTYKSITYKNIYPNIDLVLHSREEGMKYEFVVYLGGKVGDIKLQWNGLDKIEKLDNSNIKYSFPLGNMTETAPFTYMANVGATLAVALDVTDNTQTKIESRFILKNNRISFKVGKFDKRKPLVIDPQLIWGTYFGGSDQDEGYGVATDQSGNVYITGTTGSKTGVATNGSYQKSLNGVWDAFLAKFDNNGKIQWSTYFGGDSITTVWSVATDRGGNIYIVGYTNCKIGIASSAAFQTSFGGGQYDAYLAKFNTAGSRIWSTYFGGNNNDVAYGICADATSNIYISGVTSSSNNITTSGAYQTILEGGGDAFLAKFNNSGSLLWATYFGGNSGENNATISIDPSGNIYVSGSTGSSTGIATSGAYQTSLAGGGDAFLAKFSSSGGLLWATYFGGNNSEQGFSVNADAFGNVYIAGYSLSTSGIATTGAFQTSTSGWDAFLAKFSANGALQWATYFGGAYYTDASSVATDSLGNVYFSGYTESKTAIATSGAYQTSLTGNFDAFIAKFDKSGNCLWSSYIGVAGIISNIIETGLATDKAGNIYLTAYTINDANVVTQGAYQTSYGGKTDAFLVKFDGRRPYDLGLLGFLSLNDSICPGQPSIIIVEMENYGYDSVMDINFSWKINGKVEGNISDQEYFKPGVKLHRILDINHVFQDNDTIVAWIKISNGLDANPQNDTAKLIIHFYKKQFSGAGQTSFTICTGTHVRIGTNGLPGNTYLWTSIPPGFTSTLPNPIVNPDSFTVFHLTETNTRTGCTNSDSSVVTVTIAKAPIASPGFNQTICIGSNAVIGADPLGGITYSWNSNPAGFTSTSPKAGVGPDITTTYSLTVKNAIGCSDLGTVTVFVNPLPLAITGPPQTVCSDVFVQLGTVPIKGHTYLWSSNPIGFTSTKSNPTFVSDITSTSITSTYYLTETIVATGCSKTDSVLITVLPMVNRDITVQDISVFTKRFTLTNPNYPAYNYKWDFGDGDTASGYSVTHTFRKNDTFYVNLAYSLLPYCVAENEVMVVINEKFSLNIFSNPFAIQTDIHYILTNPAHIKISIVDMLGRDITSLLDKNLDIGEYNTIFDASILKTRPDMYLVIFMIDDKVIVRKIVQLESGFY